MQCKWLWVVLVAFLFGGWCECEGCWDQEKTALLQLKPFFTHIDDVENYWMDGKQSSDCCGWERVECNTSTRRVIQLFLNLTTTEVEPLKDLVYSTSKINSYAEYELEWIRTETKRDYWYLNASLFLPFEELRSLYLSGNFIAGCVDNQGFERLSSKLDKLEILDLSNNAFNGSILGSLSELSSLKSLYLGDNQFRGSNSIEGIKRLSKLNKLETLDLRGNILRNNILSHLYGFISLTSLRLQNCGLKGTVDMSEFNNLINLKELYLGKNEIKSLGSVFQSEGQLRLPKLEVLGLSINQFNNSVFSSLAVLSNLKYLYMSINKLEGAINIKELNALSNLVELDMWNNKVTEFVPSQDSENELRLMNLELLDLGRNLFNSSILSSLGRLSNLKSLSLTCENLEGSIDLGACSFPLQSLDLFPLLRTLSLFDFSFYGILTTPNKEIGQRLMNLEVLDLSVNFKNTSILSSLGRLSNLKSLSLSCQYLEGSIDIGACSLPLQSLNLSPSLETLYLEGFSVYGTWTTQSALHLKNLESLVIILTSLENNFLQKIEAMSSLKFLELWSCELNGTLQIQGLLQWKNLESLVIAYTNLENNFFQKIGEMPTLKFLELRSCKLKDTLQIQGPLQWKNLESLVIEETSLENNFLQEIGAMPSLKFLELWSYEFKDTLQIQGPLQWKNLESLVIGETSLENNFLQEIGAMPSLKFLELWSCELRGILQIQGPLQWKNLESLVIRKTSLENNFLHEIGAMPSLKFLELWSCELKGILQIQGPLQWKNLESLVIKETSLENKFLQKIGAMPSLQHLVLSDCGLSDTLHYQGFCELTNIRELDISYNNLKGNLPECFSNLTSLESLDLSSNQFSGNIFVLNSLTSLENLHLSNNNFEIPSSLEPLFNLSKLQYVYADNNTMYAETQMHSLAPTFQLNSISLSCCGKVGPFPQFLYHQHELQYVDLSSIGLIGEFPNWLLENNSNLDTLVIANNSLLGHFELPFRLYTSLSELDISKNSFYGNIPNEMGAKLPSLRSLNMSKNYFGGSIPISIGNMNSLQILDLSNNKLTGGVPEHLAIGCSSLRVLVLSNNNLQGQIFSSNFNLINLRELQLDGNNFSVRIPDCLSNCFSLSTLDLSNNQIFGDIPIWMENISSLSTLDLSNNKLFGEIPRWMGKMSNLEEIVMANNHLEGPIPMEFCQLNLHLKLLDLSMNNISGSIPSCFSPLWISQVHLSRNKLQGPLTNAFHNSTILVTLDLSNNHLTGSIPNWIGKLSQLSHLLLNNNHFEGVIPAQLCKLGHLSLIDLSQNNLSGTIPPCLKITTLNDISQDYVRYVAAVAQAPSSFSTDEPIEFTTKNISYSYKGRVLTYLSGIDLSCNKLTGEIPHKVKNFQKIIVLNLSHNSLTGSIPPAISDLRQIESLDLSYNNLSGKIPSQLVGLNYLSYFSVAYNNLSGSTPERTAQFATFEENSYLGNPFLCGPPLPNNCSTEGPSSSMPKASTDKGSIDMNVFYVSFVVSYIMAVLGIASVLYINPYWRQAWFYHVEASITSCYYFVVDNLLPKRFR